MNRTATWLRGLLREESRQRTQAVQIAKSTLAAIVAWVLAHDVLHSPAGWLAPMTAVLMVHSTVYRSVLEGLRRVVAVAIGVLLATTVGHLIGLNPIGLALVVPAGLVAARLRWIGAQGEFVAITAVVVLTFGVSTSGDYLLGYVVDTAIGAAVGAVVNALVFPPLYLHSTQAAVQDFGHQIRELLRDVADGVGSGWTTDDADEWVRRSKALGSDADWVQSTINYGRESQWWNAWLSRDEPYPAQSYQPALDTLQQIVLQLRGVVLTLRDASRADDLAPPDPAFLRGFAELLELFGGVVAEFARLPVRSSQEYDAAVTERIAHADRLHRDLTRRLHDGRLSDAGAWPVGGSLLLDVRRILEQLTR